MKFSLITVTTGRRPQELRRLCDSLAGQTHREFEHIIIDHRAHPDLKGNLSRARNLGLSLAQGDVVAFPDDDAWYGSTVLESVADVLSREDVDGVSFRVTDEQGICSAGGWMDSRKLKIEKDNVWRTAVSCSFFVKRQSLGGLLFDERLGAGSGTRFGSGEETDFLLRLIECGRTIFYDGTRTVYHPLFAGKYTMRRGWLYGNGCGFVLRRHGYGLGRLVWMIALQTARCLQAVIAIDVCKASYHLAMAVGRSTGFLFP